MSIDTIYNTSVKGAGEVHCTCDCCGVEEAITFEAGQALGHDLQAVHAELKRRDWIRTATGKDYCGMLCHMWEALEKRPAVTSEG